jgi:hypothetical protein
MSYHEVVVMGHRYVRRVRAHGALESSVPALAYGKAVSWFRLGCAAFGIADRPKEPETCQERSFDTEYS